MTGSEIQAANCDALANSFEPGQVVSEWNMRKGATDAFQDAASYAPRLDVAIGPFNLSFQNREQDNDRLAACYFHSATRQREHPACDAATTVSHPWRLGWLSHEKFTLRGETSCR